MKEPDWLKVLPPERQEYLREIVNYTSIDGEIEYEWRRYADVTPQIELLVHIINLLGK